MGIIITLATFGIMEFMAWSTHRFVMHGFMWYFHEDHHVPHQKIFERNDVFFLIYAIPSWLCIMLGMMNASVVSVSIGFGILLYGIAYFLVHDVLIHRRFKWFDKTDNWYFRALRKAHKVHHKNQGKEEGQCFGMLWVPLRYFKEAKKAKQQQWT
jgi:beta-carotene 3-hydroxylase